MAKITDDEIEKDEFQKSCDEYRKLNGTLIFAQKTLIACKLSESNDVDDEEGSSYHFAFSTNETQDFSNALNHCNILMRYFDDVIQVRAGELEENENETETETIVNTNELEEVGQSTMQWLFGKFLC